MGDLEGALGSTSAAVSELGAMFSLFESYGIGDWVELDASVVRGLAYYTGPVFEAHDRAGELRAVCGGGRYDRLIGTLGGKDLPATGFGFGDMVVMELLRDKGLVPDIPHGAQDVVFGMGAGLRGAGGRIRHQVRGRSADLCWRTRR